MKQFGGFLARADALPAGTIVRCRLSKHKAEAGLRRAVRTRYEDELDLDFAATTTEFSLLSLRAAPANPSLAAISYLTAYSQDADFSDVRQTVRECDLSVAEMDAEFLRTAEDTTFRFAGHNQRWFGRFRAQSTTMPGRGVRAPFGRNIRHAARSTLQLAGVELTRSLGGDYLFASNSRCASMISGKLTARLRRWSYLAIGGDPQKLRAGNRPLKRDAAFQTAGRGEQSARLRKSGLPAAVMAVALAAKHGTENAALPVVHWHSRSDRSCHAPCPALCRGCRLCRW
jgi:hypothetical protein